MANGAAVSICKEWGEKSIRGISSDQISSLIYTGNTEHGNPAGGPSQSLLWKSADKVWFRRKHKGRFVFHTKTKSGKASVLFSLNRTRLVTFKRRQRETENVAENVADQSDWLDVHLLSVQSWLNGVMLHQLVSPLCKVQCALLPHQEWLGDPINKSYVKEMITRVKYWLGVPKVFALPCVSFMPESNESGDRLSDEMCTHEICVILCGEIAGIAKNAGRMPKYVGTGKTRVSMKKKPNFSHTLFWLG